MLHLYPSFIICLFIYYVHTQPLSGPFSRTTRVSRYQKGKTNLDFTEARDSEWQWHQLGRMQVCTLLQTENHTSTSPLSFLQAGYPSCHPTNSVRALKASRPYLFIYCVISSKICTIIMDHADIRKINIKSCSLSIMLRTTDQTPQKVILPTIT